MFAPLQYPKSKMNSSEIPLAAKRFEHKYNSYHLSGRGGLLWGNNMLVQQIRPIEQVHLDRNRLGTLYSQLGEAGAEEVVCRALEELSQRLGQCDTLYRASEWAALRKNARSLIAISEQIGMHGVAIVARDVTNCLDHGDNTAVAATLSRLVRVGERSLNAIWDMQNAPS